MDKEGFRNRMKQYKEAKGFDPLLKYWEWKQKYDSAPQPDEMPSQPKQDTSMTGSQLAENRAHRWDNDHYVDPVNTVFDADRHRSWKEPELKTFGKRVKFTYRDFMKPADVKHMKFLQSIGRLGNTLKGASIFSEVVQNLFPSEEAELIEDLRVKMDKQNKWLTGQEDIPMYDEGTDAVTGPPTEEQWWLEQRRYNPKIIDDYSFDKSIELLKEELHNKAMQLPGYAPMWNEYVRTLPKAEPDINEFVDDLWENENPNNAGYNRTKNKYFPHKSPEGGKKTIGPGFKLGSGLHRISEREANRGVTKYRLDQEARRLGNQHLDAVNTFLNQGQTTNPADTVSPQIKMGLMDLRHQVGPLGEWGKLRDAVLEGDIDKIRKESTVTWNDNGEVKVDKRRKNIRDNKYFHYAEGGQVEPDPLEVLERSKPKFHGIPLAKGNIDGVFSPIDVPLATLPKVWSAVNKWLPNYGPTLGALIVGDNGQPVNKSAKPIATKRIEPDVEEFYRDIVIPLRPQEDYVKNIYLTSPSTFKYNVYPDDALPSNRVAEYSPTTGEIRVKESMLNSPQLDQTLAHDGSHDLEKLLRTKEAQDIIDEALVALKNPISKESNLIQEKGAEVTRMGYNAFKYMKDHGLMQVKNPLAKTKAYQDYVLNATLEQLAEMMGDFTAYSRDYKAGKIDYDKIRWALAYAPEIAVGLIVPQHLLNGNKEEKQWT